VHDAKQIKEKLLTNIEAVCFHLLPNGKVEGHEFRAADVTGRPSRHNGGKGGSLAVSLKGDTKGLWKDHGDTTQKGDIYDLWCACKGTTFKEAFPEICRYLGVTNIERPKPKAKPPRPDTSGMGSMTGTPTLAYLTKKRGLTEDTLKAYRIRSHSRPSEHNTDFVAFRFIDSEGEPVMLKSTGIKPTAAGKKDTWSTPPYYTLWGWWLVKPSDRAIVITEGEYDAMSLHQIDPGMPVLSLPAGSSNLTFIENDYDALQRFERIYIASDMDDAGEACARELAKRLGPARCLRVPIPAPHKDANDALVNGGPEDIEVSAWFAKASSYDPPTLRGTGAFRDEVRNRLRREKQEDACNTFVFPDIPFQLRDGECTLLTGYTGHGKSELAYQILSHEMASGLKVCVASFEIDPSEMICNFATQLLGKKPTEDDVDKAVDWLDGRLWFVSPKDDEQKMTASAEVFADFSYAAQRFGCRRFMVDSLMFVCKKDDYEGQDTLAKKCRDFSRKQHSDSHVILIAHSAIKKGEDKLPHASEVLGSAGILAPFNNGLTVWRNVAKGEKIEAAKDDAVKLAEIAKEYDGVLSVWKQRRTGKRPTRRLWFNPDSRTFRTKHADAPPPPVNMTVEVQTTLTDDNRPF